MELSLIADEGDVIRVRCTGDIVNTYAIEPEPLEKLLGGDFARKKVLLNLEGVKFIDSSGISWLLIRHKKMKEAGGKLVLHDIPPLPMQVLEFVKMPMVLHIVRDEAAARNLAGGAQP